MAEDSIHCATSNADNAKPATPLSYDEIVRDREAVRPSGNKASGAGRLATVILSPPRWPAAWPSHASNRETTDHPTDAPSADRFSGRGASYRRDRLVGRPA